MAESTSQGSTAASPVSVTVASEPVSPAPAASPATPDPTPPVPTPPAATPTPSTVVSGFGHAFVTLVSKLLAGELVQDGGSTVKMTIDPVNDLLSFSISQKIKFVESSPGTIGIVSAAE